MKRNNINISCKDGWVSVKPKKNGSWNYADFISHLQIANPNVFFEDFVDEETGDVVAYRIGGSTPYLGKRYVKDENDKVVLDAYLYCVDCDVLAEITPAAYDELVADNQTFAKTNDFYKPTD